MDPKNIPVLRLILWLFGGFILGTLIGEVAEWLLQ